MLFLYFDKKIMVIEQTLRSIWFSEKEIKIYVKCLEFGKITAGEIAKETLENRATVYSVLKDMQEKWYIHEVNENKIKQFSATEPQNIVAKIRNRASLLEHNIPEFQKIAHTSDVETKVRVYHGEDQVATIFDDIIKNNDEALELIWNINISTKAKDYLSKIYMPQKIQYRTQTRSIVSEECKNIINEKQDKKLMRSRKYISDLNFWKDTIIYIYGKNKVATIHTNKKKMFGIVMENTDLYTTYKAIFESLWML